LPTKVIPKPKEIPEGACWDRIFDVLDGVTCSRDVDYCREDFGDATKKIPDFVWWMDKNGEHHYDRDGDDLRERMKTLQWTMPCVI
jgi:hypothetical protein